MGFMLSLQDDGNIQQPTAIPNQRVIGDEQVPDDVPWSPRPVQLQHERHVQSTTVQILATGYLLANFQALR